MNVEIAERLAHRRREAGLSQETLAEKLGVSRQAVSKWERSESSPDTDNLIALAQLYGVSLDELLYVDESFKDDVVFEAADRAAERKAEGVSSSAYAATPVEDASKTAGGSEPTPHTETAEAEANSSAEPTKKTKHKEKVTIGLGGIHVKDGDDYVHISLRDGVHVRDSRKGDEVHVGWSGIHVQEGKKKDDERGCDNQEGNTVIWSDEGLVINGEHFDSWHDAQKKYGHGHWGKPKGYTVNGEYFTTLDAARARYGDEVGKSIPVQKHYHYVKRTWVKFPFPLLVIIAYILLGVFADQWGLGLFVFFTIPLYYMIAEAVTTKKVASFFAGLYPLASVAWFLYMAFVLNQPHPAWVIFLTIPLMEWFIYSVSRARKRRRKKKQVIDVEPKK